MAQTKLNEEQVDLTNYKKAAQTTAEINAAVQTHNTDGSAHADIRTQIGTDIAAHNTSTSAHADIRSTLAGKAEQTALAAHTARTDNPHAVTKVQVGLGNVDNTADADKPVSAAAQAALDLKANSAEVDADISDINAALERKQDDGDFHPEDYGWPDIRPAARPNAIVLLAGVASDYSAYDNLGFAATCEGGYNVFIDGVQYGDTYASGAQCSITWSQYSATAGFPVTQPQALTAHIVQIVPATYGNTISAYTSARVASSGREEQGVLWCHINSLQTIGLESAFAKYNSVLNKNFTALTCAAESIKVSSFAQMLGQGSDLYSFYSDCTFIPTLDLGGQTMPGVGALNTNGLKKIKIKNGIISQVNALFFYNTALRKIELDEVILRCDAAAAGGYVIDNFLYNAQSLQELPQVDMTDCQRAYPFISNAVSLKDTYLDFGYATKLKRLGIYGTSQYPIKGIKQLLVSQQAPFDYASAPQINVSYTGLDQNALVALFNSLPYNVGYTVVGSPTIQNGVASGFSSNNCLKLNGQNQIGTSFVLKGKFRTPSVFPSQNEYIRSYFADKSFGYSSGIYLNTENKLCWYIGRKVGTDGILFTYQSALSPNTDYWYKAEFVGGNFIFSISSDGTYYEEVARATNIFPDDLVFFRQTIGAQYFSQTNIQNPFSGSIYLNEFYEEFNGYPCFRGTAAMDKTINITGATGAASLTAEQLAIATDKGWTVTR